jgi:hypothetical protein
MINFILTLSCILILITCFIFVIGLEAYRLNKTVKTIFMSCLWIITIITSILLILLLNNVCIK